jgi:tryptophan-rich sensory protein
MKKENIIKYGIPVLSVALVALLGSIFTNIGKEWFNSLEKPSEWIAGFVIPIVWSVIYSLFAIYLIYLVKKDRLNDKLFVLLVLNGFLNVLWCLVYFALNSLLGGEIIIILNLIASILLIKEILKTNKYWGCVLLIYPTWLSIATFLNSATWILN